MGIVKICLNMNDSKSRFRSNLMVKAVKYKATDIRELKYEIRTIPLLNIGIGSVLS